MVDLTLRVRDHHAERDAYQYASAAYQWAILGVVAGGNKARWRVTIDLPAAAREEHS
jgi:hypothetical protein